MNGPDQALPNPSRKVVQSTAPAPGLRDTSADLRRHRATTDASVTTPPGGYPKTVGGNPNPPAVRQSSDEGAADVTVAPPGPYSQATKWIGGGANY